MNVADPAPWLRVMRKSWFGPIGAVLLLALVLSRSPSMVDWLQRPWSGSTDHHLPAWEAWHGRLMVAAWAILIPLGVIVARFFKVWPGQNWPDRLDDRRWWHLHRALQGLGIAAASIALYLAWRNTALATPAARVHAWLGWTVMGFGWGQIVGGFLRGTKGGPTAPSIEHGLHGDHFMMTRRRVIFELVHKNLGYFSLVLALVTVPLGLVIADAPRWMWIVIACWWAVLLAMSARLQRAGRCIDTYQAIWGASADLPGNRLRPIGYGISRREPQ